MRIQFLPGVRMIFSLAFLIVFHNAFSQPVPNNVRPDYYNTTQSIYAITANRAPSSGSNEKFLLSSGWVKGIVYFKDGTQYKDGELQFDIERNELHFNKNGSPNVFSTPVLYFMLGDTAKKSEKVIVFGSGYPQKGSKTANSFYELVTIGPNIHLLKYLSGKKREVAQYNEAATIEYKIAEDWYVYDVKNDAMELINKTSSSIQKALPAYATSIGQLLNGKSKHLSDDEIIDLINKLNDARLNKQEM